VSFDVRRFLDDGFAITAPLLSPTEIAELIALIEEDVDPKSQRGGVRDVMNRIPALLAVAESPAVRSIVDEVLGRNAFVVRSTLFDKTQDANWKVPWHQDVTIAVRERIDTEGYGPWSIKQGVAHVQSPTEVLNQMVTVRVHLDPCPAENGALRVMPGSHRLGRIDQNRASEFVDEKRAAICEVQPGAALVMRPILLHASSTAQMATHRRVLHFDFAAVTLPNNLEWSLRRVS
jgi:ectoine hydroxylase-related dioxygenase (phytanoyl-CoA dioxygenase family)